MKFDIAQALMSHVLLNLMYFSISKMNGKPPEPHFRLRLTRLSDCYVPGRIRYKVIVFYQIEYKVVTSVINCQLAKKPVIYQPLILHSSLFVFTD